jgi:prepilin-type N-terminal cleavage/methylation domain-containing protein/prepilin-type processing-associated H-X9-DG protein
MSDVCCRREEECIMYRRAFTLIEALTVVAILALLLAILMPSLSSAKSLTRAAICKSHLNEIGKGFSIDLSTRLTKPQSPHQQYLTPRDWPAVPANVLCEPKVLLCPEDDGKSTPAVTTSLQFHSGASDFTVDAVPGTFVRMTTGANYLQFAFEDWVNGDWDFNDFVVKVYTDTNPTVLQVVSAESGAKNSILFNGRVVVDDPRTCIGAKVELDWNMSGTNYGFNAAVNRNAVGPGTIVALDYKVPVANNNEVKATNLAGRHLGKCNILKADGSVETALPSRINPEVNSAYQVFWDP